jgi:hypothetical protein
MPHCVALRMIERLATWCITGVVKVVWRMAFRIPTFNLTCNVWRTGNVVANPPDTNFPCNLSPGRRVLSAALGNTSTGASSPSLLMEILLPARSDVRPAYIVFASPTQGDVVEVPAGTGRYYCVQCVDDVARGFPNEYRIAILQPMDWIGRSMYTNPNACPDWPLPIP